ncbi:MAG TPA: bifunctional phosphopantothenoylcysteine decarboxylase/phosphopantothenate--cysteine ligase CoaBC [Syntrophaceae bacterium]|nr:bifunctional phosphopantothenoylcysteine decarboxylase/phosphopantothenate--cysteine ligase CoaBC [Syntrophaceae bacterium]
MPLKEKNIILGICGGIAAYKSADLISKLTKMGANVHVVMTKSAIKFITPLTLETLSGNRVFTNLFPPPKGDPLVHVDLADKADIIVVAPATANTLGKFAHGIADNLLSTLILATQAPILICPAMNTNMWQNEIVKANVQRLKDMGFYFVEPEWGELACGVEGYGRLAEVETIVEEIKTILSSKDLAGQKVLVTAGSTQEPLDPVRFLSNPSSGKMGYAMAKVARRRGAEVTLITGPTTLTPPRGVRVLGVKTALEMKNTVLDNFEDASIIVKAAAVSDFRPQRFFNKKVKKTPGKMEIGLKRNPDILKELGKKKGNRILVGFAAETHDIIKHAQKKLKEKNVDLMVVNPIGIPGAGFGSDTNMVKILDRKGDIVELPLMTKEKVAEEIWDKVVEIIRSG